jgi:hypothetical protein
MNNKLAIISSLISNKHALTNSATTPRWSYTTGSSEQILPKACHIPLLSPYKKNCSITVRITTCLKGK